MERWEESLKRARSAARAAEGQTDATSRKYASEQAKFGSTYAVESAGGKAKAESEPLTVSGAMALAKGALENVTVKLVGEVSEVSNKAGYKAVYFTVKDQKASLPCMMWLNRDRACGVELDVGALVELTGRFTLYAPKGRMNFDVFSVSLAGEGNLRMQVANLARKLYVEGLTDEARKRPVPANIQVVGLVTSPRGDAVHDVLRTLRRRWPLARVLVAGVPVEGARAPQELVRGGGSYEDLMPFNDEGLARAIAAGPVPVVTGIGHEPDVTIADMVADRRCSTPTAAAESVAPAIDEVERQMNQRHVRLGRSMAALLETREASVESLARLSANAMGARLSRLEVQIEGLGARRCLQDPMAPLESRAADLAQTEERLHDAIPRSLSRKAEELSGQASRLRGLAPRMLRPAEAELGRFAGTLDALSPLKVLSRGYAIATDEAGHVIKEASELRPGQPVGIRLGSGRVSAQVTSVE